MERGLERGKGECRAEPRAVRRTGRGITLARRRCCACRRTTAIQLWPWSGRLAVTTHGLCEPCRRELIRKEHTRHPLPERAVVSDLLN